VRETIGDLARLQELLDRSYESSGPHMASIITPERRLSARQLSDRLVGMRLLALATATRDGRPLVAPVDGVFYRGAFWFGSGRDAVRFRHIRRRPAVSATHIPSEELAVTVHGTAVEVDLASPEWADLRDVYVDIYGASWADWGESAAYARIDADRMFTFYLSPEDRAAHEARQR
jgi:hypothetical protein